MDGRKREEFDDVKGATEAMLAAAEEQLETMRRLHDTVRLMQARVYAQPKRFMPQEGELTRVVIEGPASYQHAIGREGFHIGGSYVAWDLEQVSSVAPLAAVGVPADQEAEKVDLFVADRHRLAGWLDACLDGLGHTEINAADWLAEFEADFPAPVPADQERNEQ